MKKLILVSAFVVGLMATLGLANQSLGGWQEGAPRSTHQVWSLELFEYTGEEPYNVKSYADGDTSNPFGVPTAYIHGDVAPASFMPLEGENYVDVMLQIGNYPDPLDRKEIWIDIDYDGVLTNWNVIGYGQDYPYTVSFLKPLYNSDADMGFRISPNPAGEVIFFRIESTDVTNNNALLHSIHADTICVPVPGAILLGGIGAGLVGWLRKKKAL